MEAYVTHIGISLIHVTTLSVLSINTQWLIKINSTNCCNGNCNIQYYSPQNDIVNTNLSGSVTGYSCTLHDRPKLKLEILNF